MPERLRGLAPALGGMEVSDPDGEFVVHPDPLLAYAPRPDSPWANRHGQPFAAVGFDGHFSQLRLLGRLGVVEILGNEVQPVAEPIPFLNIVPGPGVDLVEIERDRSVDSFEV